MNDRQSVPDEAVHDVAIIGGGVNGCGIARDLAGRGASVLLCEQGDLAQATSSASTKLFHGGLRYLEHYEFRLVREALVERETLLRAMPHISWPLRFVLPHHEGLRPAWLLRLGLFLYDHLGGREILPGTRTLDLRMDDAGAPLKAQFRKGFEYSDCWVEDSRLVVLNARDAADRGADIRTRTRCENATRDTDGLWRLSLRDMRGDTVSTARARTLVNAGGPWVQDVILNRTHRDSADRIRLVRGSHIVTRRLFTHDRAYIFQQTDGRIVFAIPYEGDFTLIGTTDADHQGPPSEAVCTPEERDYLLNAVAGYFEQPPTAADIVWTYSGVRPLFDDGASAAAEATRDYVLKLDRPGEGEPPLLNIFGGKITTYRRLAEAAAAKLAPFLPGHGAAWTAGAPLPGGDFPVDGVADLVRRLAGDYPFLDPATAKRLIRAYGTQAWDILGTARAAEELGEAFGAGLTAAEVRWLITREWAVEAEDVLWRRSKLGLRLSDSQKERLARFMRAETAPDPIEEETAQ
ncbi:glycerol-3-phosphate dehydrogenase [Marivibrio halodurans]|uniref:Glycerol-3-phosphate dehydrogenase n=1 Tax=Marivibrio halodurans TaxID=2039722 RepID=A0A8J7SLY1_9PROT|nr:glycerol-3-phosphate dehydrogenase [Marivibrio halodurans]MBP5856566.1 glycerol-3-phosphate dehydrogenase [Marivibrio halodurans]